MYVIQANVLFVSPQVMSENLRIFYVFEKEKPWKELNKLYFPKNGLNTFRTLPKMWKINEIFSKDHPFDPLEWWMVENRHMKIKKP